MDRLRGLRARLRAIVMGRRADHDLDDEIASHLEMATDITAMVMRHSLILGGSGVVIGVGVSLAATKAMRSLLYGVSPVDPATLLVVGVVLAAAAVAASMPTAWRASRVNPMETLRAD